MKNQNSRDNQTALPAPVIEAIQNLVDYVHEDEQRSFEEADGPEGHIFHDILMIEAWLSRHNG